MYGSSATWRRTLWRVGNLTGKHCGYIVLYLRLRMFVMCGVCVHARACLLHYLKVWVEQITTDIMNKILAGSIFSLLTCETACALRNFFVLNGKRQELSTTNMNAVHNLVLLKLKTVGFGKGILQIVFNLRERDSCVFIQWFPVTGNHRIHVWTIQSNTFFIKLCNLSNLTIVT